VATEISGWVYDRPYRIPTVELRRRHGQVPCCRSPRYGDGVIPCPFGDHLA